MRGMKKVKSVVILHHT